jgi:hypothetical protein
MTLQEILNDSKTFTDDLEMQLGEHKVKLGDLRGLTTKQQKDLSDKLTAASERERVATEMATKASEIYNNLDAMQKKAIEAEAARGKQPTGEEDEWETNNWWTPARKRVAALESQLKAEKAERESLKAAFEKAAVMFATERWSNQFERVASKLKKSKDYADWDRDKVREYATKNNILDEFGFPSVDKAVNQLTRVDDIEEAKKLAREEGIREGLQRSRLAATSRPSSAGGGKGAGAKRSAVEEHGLEGLGDDVMSDDELMQQLEEAQKAFDPSQLQ